jgi:hypothetical protein
LTSQASDKNMPSYKSKPEKRAVASHI